MAFRVLLGSVGGAVMMLAFVQASASAAPTLQNKNIEPVDVDCGDPIGMAFILTMGNGVPAFLQNGQVVVGKRDSGEATFTITTADGLVSVGPFSNSFEAGAKGKGFEGRLVECSFSGPFTDPFTLTPGVAALFGIPEDYVGTKVTAEGTATGTASVVIPGK